MSLILKEACFDETDGKHELRGRLQRIQEMLAETDAQLSERKTVHEWLTALNIPGKEAGAEICLLRRLRIACDQLAERDALRAALEYAQDFFEVNGFSAETPVFAKIRATLASTRATEKDK